MFTRRDALTGTCAALLLPGPVLAAESALPAHRYYTVETLTAEEADFLNALRRLTPESRRLILNLAKAFNSLNEAQAAGRVS